MPTFRAMLITLYRFDINKYILQGLYELFPSTETDSVIDRKTGFPFHTLNTVRQHVITFCLPDYSQALGFTES